VRLINRAAAEFVVLTQVRPRYRVTPTLVSWRERNRRMNHQFLGLTELGIADLLTLIGAQELATYQFRDEQEGLTHVLVALDLGLVDLRVQNPDNVEGLLHRWSEVRADLAWTSVGSPLVPGYRLVLSILANPVPRLEDGTPVTHAWEDLRRHVMERATGT
jgi:hypothetical protein